MYVDWLKVWVVLVGGYRPVICIVDVDWLKVWVGLVGGYRQVSFLWILTS